MTDKSNIITSIFSEEGKVDSNLLELYVSWKKYFDEYSKASGVPNDLNTQINLFSEVMGNRLYDLLSHNQ